MDALLVNIVAAILLALAILAMIAALAWMIFDEWRMRCDIDRTRMLIKQVDVLRAEINYWNDDSRSQLTEQSAWHYADISLRYHEVNRDIEAHFCESRSRKWYELPTHRVPFMPLPERVQRIREQVFSLRRGGG